MPSPSNTRCGGRQLNLPSAVKRVEPLVTNPVNLHPSPTENPVRTSKGRLVLYRVVVCSLEADAL